MLSILSVSRFFHIRARPSRVAFPEITASVQPAASTAPDAMTATRKIRAAGMVFLALMSSLLRGRKSIPKRPSRHNGGGPGARPLRKKT